MYLHGLLECVILKPAFTFLIGEAKDYICITISSLSGKPTPKHTANAF